MKKMTPNDGKTGILYGVCHEDGKKLLIIVLTDLACISNVTRENFALNECFLV